MRIKEGYDYADAFELMCHYYMSLFEGGTSSVESALELMRRHKFIDENNELIDPEEDDD